jgi:transposase
MKAERLSMSTKEIRRVEMMRMVDEGTKTLSNAASVLDLSYRQVKRIYRRYREEGAGGLIHRNVGNRSHRRIDDDTRRRALACYRESYRDFGPTFAAEKLLEREKIRVDHETLRRWLVSEGLWEVKRNRHQYRQRRERRHRFGELVQFDGSHHEWFEDRAPKSCLMNMVDDATGKTLSFLDEQETTAGAMQLLWGWIGRYGIPQAAYCDRKNAFVLDREPTIAEQLAGITPRSPFELACEKLGIEVIVARSPQAKGRVERNHGVYQDRFVKELRLAGISSIEAANEFLEHTYLPQINSKFSKPPIAPEDAHVALLKNQRLEDVFCFEEQRVVSPDYVLRFDSKFYQIKQNKHRVPSPGTKVTARKWLDDSIHFSWKNTELLVEEIVPSKKKQEDEALTA